MGDNAKRDRDEMLLGDDGEEEDSVHVKKRQKLQRIESTASFASLGSAADMERQDSNYEESFAGSEE